MKKNHIYYIVIIFYLILITRLSYLMIIKHDYYNELVLKNNNRIIYGNSAPRGRILDKNGVIIVDNVGIKTIIYSKLSGVYEKDEIDIAYKLASIIEIEESSGYDLKYFYYINNKEYINSLLSDSIKDNYKNRKIDDKTYLEEKINLVSDNMLEELSALDKKAAKIYSLMNKGYSYENKVIKTNCTDEEYSNVIDESIIGVRGELTFKRINNYDNTLKDTIGSIGSIPKEDIDYYKKLGYKNNDIVGISYLEKYYEEYLKGEKSEYKVNPDNTLSLVKKEKRGNDLVLNIDIKLQEEIESILENEIINAKEYDSSRYYNGSYIIVSDVKSGGIISFVGKSYNNGEFYNNEIGNITKSYTVGSVVKAATISIGYKYNIIDIGDAVYDSCVKLKNKTKKCSWKNLGYVDDLTALKNSSNYYQFLIAIGLTGEKYKYNMSLSNLDYAFNIYRDTLSSYGLGSITGIDLYNESTGIEGSTISDDLLLNLSIGQYDTYTPIELSQYINTIANDGVRIKPSLMMKIIDDNGNVLKENESTILNKVDLEDKYRKRIKEALRSVAESGTGYSYIPQEYNASSKTGTSEAILDTNNDGISDTYAITRTFISYMPSDDPIYSIVIVSPNIEMSNTSNYTYPINIYLARKISKILFDN